jgi:hypothetical protein
MFLATAAMRKRVTDKAGTQRRHNSKANLATAYERFAEDRAERSRSYPARKKEAGRTGDPAFMIAVANISALGIPLP